MQVTKGKITIQTEDRYPYKGEVKMYDNVIGQVYARGYEHTFVNISANPDRITQNHFDSFESMASYLDKSL